MAFSSHFFFNASINKTFKQAGGNSQGQERRLSVDLP